MKSENFQIQNYDDIISIIKKTNISSEFIQIMSAQIIYKNNKKKTKSFIQIFSCETFNNVNVNEVIYPKEYPKNLTNICEDFKDNKAITIKDKYLKHLSLSQNILNDSYIEYMKNNKIILKSEFISNNDFDIHVLYGNTNDIINLFDNYNIINVLNFDFCVNELKTIDNISNVFFNLLNYKPNIIYYKNKTATLNFNLKYNVVKIFKNQNQNNPVLIEIHNISTNSQQDFYISAFDLQNITNLVNNKRWQIIAIYKSRYYEIFINNSSEIFKNEDLGSFISLHLIKKPSKKCDFLFLI